MAKKGLIIGLSVSSVVVILAIVLIVLWFTVFNRMYYCGKLKVKEGPVGPNNMGTIDKYIPYFKDDELYVPNLLDGSIVQEPLESDAKISVYGHVFTLSDSKNHMEIDIKNKTNNINGKIEHYTDVYHNKSLNRIILLSDDLGITLGIDSSYFHC
tara:strand:- start:62 stop:526 length:465 start_codon:yes stop_codon:yes gene_type:complete